MGSTSADESSFSFSGSGEVGGGLIHEEKVFKEGFGRNPTAQSGLGGRGGRFNDVVDVNEEVLPLRDGACCTSAIVLTPWRKKPTTAVTLHVSSSVSITCRSRASRMSRGFANERVAYSVVLSDAESILGPALHSLGPMPSSLCSPNFPCCSLPFADCCGSRDSRCACPFGGDVVGSESFAAYVILGVTMRSGNLIGGARTDDCPWSREVVGLR
jgi:hypothetical protein